MSLDRKKHNKYLVYDMEMAMAEKKLRNGKSSRHWYSPHKGAITQLAWNVYDKEYILLNSENFFFKPNIRITEKHAESMNISGNWDYKKNMPTEQFQLTHEKKVTQVNWIVPLLKDILDEDVAIIVKGTVDDVWLNWNIDNCIKSNYSCILKSLDKEKNSLKPNHYQRILECAKKYYNSSSGEKIINAKYDINLLALDVFTTRKGYKRNPRLNKNKIMIKNYEDKNIYNKLGIKNFDKDKKHDAKYDVELTFLVFKKLFDLLNQKNS